LLDPEVGVAGQGVDGVRNIAVDVVFPEFLIGLGRVALENVELGQVLLDLGVLRVTCDLLELLGQGDALVDGLLVPDDALDVAAERVLVVGELRRIFLIELARVFFGGLVAEVVAQVGVGLLDEFALGVLFDERLQGRRVGLAPLRSRLAELERGGLGVGNSRLEIFVGGGALFPLGIEGDDLLVEFLGLRLQRG
jgi:hypothetical protein